MRRRGGASNERGKMDEDIIRPSPEPLSAAQFADRCHWSKSTVYRLIRAGRLYAILPNGNLRGARIPVWEVERFEREGPRERRGE